jgi:hypothetical protein
MKRALVLAFLLVSVGFSIVTVDGAVTTATQYAETGENVNIQPQGLTSIGTNSSYWVMELVGSLGKINIMIPINYQTGDVDIGNSMGEVLKTHYLANFFATDSALQEFLDSMLSYSEGKRFSNAVADLELNENQLPSNITLDTLDELKDAIDDAEATNDALMTQIQTAQSYASSAKINWKTSEVKSSQTAFDNVFTKENNFLDALDDVATKAIAFRNEIAGNIELKSGYNDLAQAFLGVVTSYGLADGAPAKMRNDLVSNKNTVNMFFSNLDLTASEYLAKLRDRYTSHFDSSQIEEIRAQLDQYSSNYTYIQRNADTLPSSYDAQRNQLYGNLTQAQSYFNKQNYTLAKMMFDTIDGLIADLADHLFDCTPNCGDNKVRDADTCECVCPAGTTEVGGKCSSGSSGFNLNMPLIGGLFLIIALLALFKYKDKIFKGGGEEIEKDAVSDMWSGYKF